jgi:hypothetical protein
VLYNLIRCRGIHFWSQKWHGTSRTHRKLHRKLVKLELYTIIGARARLQHARKHASSVDSARNLQTSYSHLFGFKLTLFHVKLKQALPCPSAWCSDSQHMKRRIVHWMCLPRVCWQAIRCSCYAQSIRRYRRESSNTVAHSIPCARTRYRNSSLHGCARWRNGTCLGLA